MTKKLKPPQKMTLLWQGRKDLNLRLQEPKSCALPLGYTPKKLLAENLSRTKTRQLAFPLSF